MHINEDDDIYRVIFISTCINSLNKSKPGLTFLKDSKLRSK